MTVFDITPEDKYEAETIDNFRGLHKFSDFKNYSSLCGVKSQ